MRTKSVLLALALPALLTAAGCATGMHDIRAPESPRHAADRYAGEGYELVWADEFDQAGRPDDSSWIYERGFVRNNEDQFYREENATVEDGLLVIEARKERVPNPRYREGSNDWRRAREHAEYTSACVLTRGKREFLYGRIEVRAKIPVGDGLWPAIWTLGSARGWPGCGEIDVMEYYQDSILANTCWRAEGGRWAQHWDSQKIPFETFQTMSETPWEDEFHVWRLEWDADRISISLDGRVLNTTDVNETFNPDGSNPFREPHYILLNLALGGTQGGDASAPDYPARYEIDYVRVYQKADSGE